MGEVGLLGFCLLLIEMFMLQEKRVGGLKSIITFSLFSQEGRELLKKVFLKHFWSPQMITQTRARKHTWQLGTRMISISHSFRCCNFYFNNCPMLLSIVI